MTQMMLFDSAALDSSPIAAPVATPVVNPPAPLPAAASGRDRVAGERAAQRNAGMPNAAATDCGDGLHHMGDLARLVLLRYQLVAQRRAEMAARGR